MPAVVDALDGFSCQNAHSHVTIQESQNGKKLSKLAAVYPPQICEVIAAAIKAL